MPRSAIRSLVPIITRSTPSTATISSIAASEAADSNCTITMVASFSAGSASVAGKLRNWRWQRAGEAARAERRVFRGGDHRARFGRRSDAGSDHAERAAVEHARNVLRGVGRHADERRDARLEPHHAELARGLHREAGMLEVD